VRVYEENDTHSEKYSTLATSPTTREKGRVEIRSIVGSFFAIFSGKKVLRVVSNEG
jgi:hypothetical protein